MYYNLKAEMSVKGVSVEEIAAVIGVHRNTAHNKINGITSFAIEEGFAIRDAKFPYASAEFLFRRGDQQVS